VPSPAPPIRIVVLCRRPLLTALLRAAFGSRHAQLQVVHSAAGLLGALRTTLVDAALVDLGTPSEDAWAGAALAREFPSAPFFALTALRATDAPVLGRCADLDVADVLVEGVDDAAVAAVVRPASFRVRLAATLAEPPAALRLASPIQRRTWRLVVERAGMPVRTDALARAVGVTREHLSRAFAAHGAPTLKRAIDLVRLIAAAELAKNPGLDLADVAAILAFGSPAHLSDTAQRILGVRAPSLARLRTIDLVGRFARAPAVMRGA
jgi:AraC-like DNA-binding protein